jgi:hypothetical protein
LRTEKTGFFEKLFRNPFSLRNPFSANAYLENGFLCVDDILFNFAESDGLSQVNQVAGARNQGLTAPELNTAC